jgi:hypothetical protein
MVGSSRFHAFGGHLICALDLGRLNLDRGSLQTGDAGHFVHLDATFDEKGDRFLRRELPSVRRARRPDQERTAEIERARPQRLPVRIQHYAMIRVASGRRSITAKNNWLHFPSPPSPLPASGASTPVRAAFRVAADRRGTGSFAPQATVPRTNRASSDTPGSSSPSRAVLPSGRR